ncbi:leucine-rich repeat protein soc-2-like [Tropilaelaps mercedesae]|uniref:Leucine-rich repeat protein soc-2-like n=1 Tax=Tropilaelaps mercedesae TaxID=418985 RepID=A0A1V9XGK0_9ACAR|nr:leucine-rich repeat protein soc-2-like [Tropilaelaps mercedesae]
MRNTQLESLDLSQNVLRKITAKLPQKFSHISSLNLSSNRLAKIVCAT